MSTSWPKHFLQVVPSVLGRTPHRFFNAVRAEAERRQLLSDDHFTLDGTLLEAWASVKSVRPKDDDAAPPSGRNPEVDFHG